MTRSPSSFSMLLSRHTRRREFITLVGGAAAWPLVATAQHDVVPVVGVLGSGSPSGVWMEVFAAFQQGLTDGGYIEGRNVTIEARWAEDHYDRLPTLAAELIGHRPAVIAAFATPAAKAAKAATATIPIVFVTIADPVQIGLVASLNHPGGNMTGVGQLGVEIEPKLLELLQEAVPSAAVMGQLVNPTNPNAATQSRTVQEAAQRLGVQLHALNASNASEFNPAFAKLSDLHVGALMVSQDVLFVSAAEQLATLSARYRIPAVMALREFAAAGGLMSYSPNQRNSYRQAGLYVGRILKGEKSSDLPVMQVTKFDFVINLKTAKAFGLNIPLPLLGRADEVIE
jgi:putative tryptophan/tyrosine transport system substrate-binding protein